jgi:predicted Zn-dependent protease
LESEADKTAVTLLQNAGYNAESLLRVLNQLKANTKPNSADFSATHPDTDDRISDVTGWLQTGAVNPVSAVRTARFYSVFKQL